MKKILLTILIFSWASISNAVENVKIGVLYPLTGPVAQVGKDAVAAVQTALDIINNSHNIDMPLAKTRGLPGAGGAKMTIVVGDHAGKPDVGVGETEKMVSLVAFCFDIIPTIVVLFELESFAFVLTISDSITK